MSQAQVLEGKRTKRAPRSRTMGHEPTIFERLCLARDSMLIARFAAGQGTDGVLARREVGRARAEVSVVTRTLERARKRSRSEPGLHLEILGMLELSRHLGQELKTLAHQISSMN